MVLCSAGLGPDAGGMRPSPSQDHPALHGQLLHQLPDTGRLAEDLSVAVGAPGHFFSPTKTIDDEETNSN